MDIIDKAKRAEMAHRDDALAAHHLRTALAAAQRPVPVVRDGVRICVDCGEDIPLARLRAEPLAARCVACKSRIESAR